MIRFAALGLDHRHIYDQVGGMLAAGATCVGYSPATSDPGVVEGFKERFPQIPAVEDKRVLLEDPSIALVCLASIPANRAEESIEIMLAGKDVMVDKPGATTLDQLFRIKQTVCATDRIFSVCYSERFATPASQVADKLIDQGEIGSVIQTIGVGPHRLNRATRPDWFFEPQYFGGILVDIASHQIDQFLHFTKSTDAEIVASSIGNFSVGDVKKFQDFGEILLRSNHASGYARVDWLTPDGLPTWGDGRLLILGTEGYIELRKYIDIAGRPGADHLFIANRAGVRHVDCSTEQTTYYSRLITDVLERTQTAIGQEHVFVVTRLAIEAQDKAVSLTLNKELRHG